MYLHFTYCTHFVLILVLVSRRTDWESLLKLICCCSCFYSQTVFLSYFEERSYSTRGDIWLLSNYAGPYTAGEFKKKLILSYHLTAYWSKIDISQFWILWPDLWNKFRQICETLRNDLQNWLTLNYEKPISADFYICVISANIFGHFAIAIFKQRPKAFHRYKLQRSWISLKIAQSPLNFEKWQIYSPVWSTFNWSKLWTELLPSKLMSPCIFNLFNNKKNGKTLKMKLARRNGMCFVKINVLKYGFDVWQHTG